MNYKKLFTYLITITLLFACSIDDNGGKLEINSQEKISVSISAAQSFGDGPNLSLSKSSIDTDYASTRWDKDDEIYIWATPKESNSFVINNVPFGIHYYGTTFSTATFTGRIDKMSSGEYTYYGVYPKPKSISGTTATYNISSNQSGKYDGVNDVMVAYPTDGEALGKVASEDFNLIFKHLMHLIRIEVPTDRNLLGEDVAKLKIEFPKNVFGDVTVNFVTGDCKYIENSNSSNTIVIDKPNIGDGNYIWLFIPPTTLSNQTINFSGYSANGERSYDISTTINKTLVAGEVTPIKLTIPTKRPPYTHIIIDVTKNNLGEDYNTIKFTAPNGALFIESSSNAITLSKNSSNKYEVSYLESAYGTAFKNNGIDITYESDNAIVTQKVSLNNIVALDDNKYNGEVPYLFYEDFSGVNEFERGTNPGGSSATHVTLSLDEYNLKGWTGDRVGGSSKAGSIRTMSRLECGLWIQAKYNGRLDSPPLSNIKSGKSINIAVTYKYSGSKDDYVGSTEGTPLHHYGYTDESGVLSAKNSIENKIGENVKQGTDGSYTNIYKNGSYSTSGNKISNICRLSWYATVDRPSEGAQGGNYWLYIDNVKVKIVK